MEASPGKREAIGYNNPTAMTVAVLAIVLEFEPLLDSFLAAGGGPALVRLLRESTCPVTAKGTASLITLLLNLDGEDTPTRRARSSKLAEQYFKSGESITIAMSGSRNL